MDIVSVAALECDAPPPNNFTKDNDEGIKGKPGNGTVLTVVALCDFWKKSCCLLSIQCLCITAGAIDLGSLKHLND